MISWFQKHIACPLAIVLDFYDDSSLVCEEIYRYTEILVVYRKGVKSDVKDASGDGNMFSVRVVPCAVCSLCMPSAVCVLTEYFLNEFLLWYDSWLLPFAFESKLEVYRDICVLPWNNQSCFCASQKCLNFGITSCTDYLKNENVGTVLWLERRSFNWKVDGSIPNCDRATATHCHVAPVKGSVT